MYWSVGHYLKINRLCIYAIIHYIHLEELHSKSSFDHLTHESATVMGHSDHNIIIIEMSLLLKLIVNLLNDIEMTYLPSIFKPKLIRRS